MAGPSVTQAYAMISALRRRGAPGDVAKVIELQKRIEEEKDKRALKDLEKFYPTPAKK